jgi:hypothetical protein
MKPFDGWEGSLLCASYVAEMVNEMNERGDIRAVGWNVWVIRLTVGFD